MVDFLDDRHLAHNWAIAPADAAPGPATAPAGGQSGLPLHWTLDRPSPAIASPFRTAQMAGKRLIDIAVSAILLLVLFPVLLALAALVGLSSPGPAIFRQWRTGRDGRAFTIYKLRSMTAGHHGAVTPLGAVLRATSLDELPQLFNVLRGDMALIGPRPHVPDMAVGGVAYAALVPYYAQRHAMRPGLSGWAQVNGYRGPLEDGPTATARVDHDLAYIQNFSLWLDFKIMWLTVLREFPCGTGR